MIQNTLNNRVKEIVLNERATTGLDIFQKGITDYNGVWCVELWYQDQEGNKNYHRVREL